MMLLSYIIYHKISIFKVFFVKNIGLIEIVKEDVAMLKCSNGSPHLH